MHTHTDKDKPKKGETETGGGVQKEKDTEQEYKHAKWNALPCLEPKAVDHVMHRLPVVEGLVAISNVPGLEVTVRKVKVSWIAVACTGRLCVS